MPKYRVTGLAFRAIQEDVDVVVEAEDEWEAEQRAVDTLLKDEDIMDVEFEITEIKEGD